MLDVAKTWNGLDCGPFWRRRHIFLPQLFWFSPTATITNKIEIRNTATKKKHTHHAPRLINLPSTTRGNALLRNIKNQFEMNSHALLTSFLVAAAVVILAPARTAEAKAVAEKAASNLRANSDPQLFSYQNGIENANIHFKRKLEDEKTDQAQRFRVLRPIRVFDTPTEFGKWGHCQGDCSTDSDCYHNLVCFQREANLATAVPGCRGGEDDYTATDYCVFPGDIPLSGDLFSGNNDGNAAPTAPTTSSLLPPSISPPFDSGGSISNQRPGSTTTIVAGGNGRDTNADNPDRLTRASGGFSVLDSRVSTILLPLLSAATLVFQA